jgi:hypothetical protein
VVTCINSRYCCIMMLFWFDSLPHERLLASSSSSCCAGLLNPCQPDTGNAVLL